MHAQEVLASQEHATRPRSKNIVCFFFETQEVESLTKRSRKKPQELMNLTASRKMVQEVATGQTVCLFILFISAMSVVEMLSACSQCYP